VNVDLLTSRNESTWAFTAKHCCTLFTNWVLLAYRRQGGMLCGLASRWGRSGSNIPLGMRGSALLDSQPNTTRKL
jgi:hypothetical protein